MLKWIYVTKTTTTCRVTFAVKFVIIAYLNAAYPLIMFVTAFNSSQKLHIQPSSWDVKYLLFFYVQCKIVL